MAKKNRNSRRINFENNNVEVNEEQTIAVSEESVEDNIDVNVDTIGSENTDTIEAPAVDTVITDNTEVIESEEDVMDGNPGEGIQVNSKGSDVLEPVIVGIDLALAEDPVEVEETVDELEVIPEVKEEKVYEPIEDPTKPIPELKPTPSPIKTPSTVKTVMKDNTEGSKRFQIVFVDKGSPLQMVKTLKRLKAVGEVFDVNDKTNTITGKVFRSFSDAVACRKALAGKGLKPSIKIIE